MFDKALLEQFNSIFQGDQVNELLRIKSEVELFGLEEFREIVWEQAQWTNSSLNEKNKEDEQNRIFKNAIFVVVQDLTIDEDLNAFRLMLMSLIQWTDYFDRSFTEFSSSSILALNDLLNQCFYYSNEDFQYDCYEPSLLEDETSRLREYMYMHNAFLNVLNENKKREECFLWDCVLEKYPNGNYFTKFGESCDWHLIPGFQDNYFHKTVYFIMSILAAIEKDDYFDCSTPHKKVRSKDKFYRLVDVFFEREIDEIKGGSFTASSNAVEFSFSSIFDLIEKTVEIYEEIISDVFFPSTESWDIFLSLINTKAEKSKII